MDATEDSLPSRKKFLPILGKLALLVFLSAGLGIWYLRTNAADRDFAEVNVFATILGIVGWLSLTVACRSAALPRWVWRTIGLAPPLFLLGFLGLYKLERLDGELNPKFVLRWSQERRLETATAGSTTIPLESLAPTEFDFPQYLGPYRNATYPKVQLAEDWQGTPPSIAWKRSIGSGWSGFAIQGDVAVTMEQRDQEEWITAIDINSGEAWWSYAIPGAHTNILGGSGPRSTPTISNDRVYAVSAISQIVCLDLASGEQLWSHDLLPNGVSDQAAFEAHVSWGRSASPLVIGEQVIVPQGGLDESAAALVSLSVQDGAVLWTAGQGQVSYSSPMLIDILGVPQVVYTSEKMLAGYLPQDGTQLWTAPAPGSSSADPNVAQPIDLGSGRILLTKGYGTGAVLWQLKHDSSEAWQIEELWRKPSVMKTKFTTAVIRDSYAYGLSDGILECISLETGKRQWKKGRYRQGQLLLVGEHLLITSEDGELVLVAAQPTAFQELAKLQVINDVTWNTPAISGNRLLMRNSELAACVILPIVNSPAKE
ncbi:outer membrane protein assembly factor BamB family protein [Aureliella helgolandensis]|uniref:Outer membrane biogenesis protein BamB n=1 Tax=Aureliella helgolandensis TaxID=2527968 RepID=A0A518GC45_9BACT|nr:PQQ-binding-like beta-propeller repeat protein [Aureliella helgolandensis]QDV26176.1 outer membrane biogenesis protein BamB [Aureliella helgolandensis]